MRWAAWLEEQVKVKQAKVDEWQAAVKFQDIRKELPLYAGDSYDAISAAGPNAALPHYETPEKGSRVIDRETPYLNDSGAQYHDGTIDCTRTVHFGRPTAEQKRAYSRVLQGHIRLSEVKFPAGTTGVQLDPVARQRAGRMATITATGPATASARSWTSMRALKVSRPCLVVRRSQLRWKRTWS